jgi:sigma-B regulation protein RsbU (phosphoserine phosphatase)
MAVEAFGGDLDGIMAALDRAWSRRMYSQFGFTSLVAVVLDAANHQVRAASAGNFSPLIRRHGVVHEFVPREAGRPLLGFGEQFRWVGHSASGSATQLNAGDAVFLFSDAIPEARNSRGEMYGLERLTRVLASTDRDALQVGEEVLADLMRFTGSPVFEDDLSAVCFVRRE